ncbi:MAG: hypothetical protein EBV09_02555 [Actinobacteria bacterium]|nr:hypothetical protein [Actinomycetota bacterium]
MKKLNNQGESQKCCNYEQSGFVDSDSEIKASEMSRLSEVFVSGSSDSRSSARITPGTLSSPNHSTITNSKSLNFIGMDVSAVISTWGLSSKGVIPHPSWEMIHIHCESSVNFGNFLPTNGDLLHRINNHNSLIREDDFGMYENQIKQGIDLNLDFEENIPEIYCFPDEINQVWTNLIYNAIQATNGKGKLAIFVKKNSFIYNNETSGILKDGIEICIMDNGTGIPKEIQKNIFDPFFTTKKAGEGTGLGLHVCKEIIIKHGGEIGFESQPGLTNFFVHLPFAN